MKISLFIQLCICNFCKISFSRQGSFDAFMINPSRSVGATLEYIAPLTLNQIPFCVIQSNKKGFKMKLLLHKKGMGENSIHPHKKSDLNDGIMLPI